MASGAQCQDLVSLLAFLGKVLHGNQAMGQESKDLGASRKPAGLWLGPAWAEGQCSCRNIR